MRIFTLDSLVTQSSNLMEVTIDGDLVIFNPSLGKYFFMREIGFAIWTNLKKTVSISDLCDILQDDFDVTRSTCEAEVFEFLEDLFKEGLIVIH